MPNWQQKVVNKFHRLYYDTYAWKNTFWLGVPTQKCPLDLWVYQEIMFELKPDVIIETGTADGGSALFLASMCDLLGKGRITTMDIVYKEDWPKHDRIRYLHGSSTADEILNEIKKDTSGQDTVMVILDSDHSKDHVSKELQLYKDFVSPGSYLIVEDTNINGYPVFDDFGPGPMEAIMEFLKTDKGFAIDTAREKFYLTFNPKGFLRKSG